MIPAIGERVTPDPPRARPRWSRLRCALGLHPALCRFTGWADYWFCNDCMRRVR